MDPLKVSIIEAPCRTLSSPKNMGIWVTKQSMDPYWLPWSPSICWFLTFFKISSFEFSKIKKLKKVWNNLRLS